jgi:hypothetical protein
MKIHPVGTELVHWVGRETDIAKLMVTFQVCERTKEAVYSNLPEFLH